MNIEQAVDEMLTLFKSVWDDTGYTAIYTDVPGSVPQTEDPWARCTIRHATGGQSSLSSDVGSQMYTQTGTIFIQVFTPVGDGLLKCQRLSQLLLNGFSKVRGNSVWYRNQRIKEIGTSGAFEQINVLIDFSYSDVR